MHRALDMLRESVSRGDPVLHTYFLFGLAVHFGASRAQVEGAVCAGRVLLNSRLKGLH